MYWISEDAYVLLGEKEPFEKYVRFKDLVKIRLEKTEADVRLAGLGRAYAHGKDQGSP